MAEIGTKNASLPASHLPTLIDHQLPLLPPPPICRSLMDRVYSNESRGVRHAGTRGSRRERNERARQKERERGRQAAARRRKQRRGCVVTVDRRTVSLPSVSPVTVT